MSTPRCPPQQLLYQRRIYKDIPRRQDGINHLTSPKLKVWRLKNESHENIPGQSYNIYRFLDSVLSRLIAVGKASVYLVSRL